MIGVMKTNIKAINDLMVRDVVKDMPYAVSIYRLVPITPCVESSGRPYPRKIPSKNPGNMLNIDIDNASAKLDPYISLLETPLPRIIV